MNRKGITISALILAMVAGPHFSFGQEHDKMKGQEGKNVPQKEKSSQMDHPTCKIIKNEDLKWGKGPDIMPPGIEVASLEGDASKAGPFTMRIKIPPGYKIPPHWHPGVEHVTVISGAFMLATGDAFDESKLEKIPQGGFVFMQPKVNHFAMVKEETIIQLHGMGPWGLNYVNPKDDPRKMTKGTN